jgi:hypothetical protein
MLTYVKSAIASHFDHPVLGLMYIVAVTLTVVGLLIEILSSWGIGAGFFAVFAVFFALVGSLGYLILFVGKGISLARDRVGPAS